MSDYFNEISFGPNTWLIDEMYRQFLDNPDTVSESWQEFLKDYKPTSQNIELLKYPEMKFYNTKKPYASFSNSLL